VAPRHDLLVRNGTLIIPGVGPVNADVAIEDGRVVALGSDLPGRAEEEIDARDKAVLPGIFDPHVHIGNERSFDAEAETETRAAILGGVTTIGIFIREIEEPYSKHMPALRRAMDERMYVDSIVHPQIFTEAQLAELPQLTAQYGIRSYKFYMSGFPGIVPAVSDDFLFEGFKHIAALGPDMVACVHCETGALVARAREELKVTQPEGTLADWAKAHPPEAEALAIQTAAYLAHCAGTHLYVVHLSSRHGLDAVRRCRAAGFRFTVETTTSFLGLNSDDANGFLAKMVPPVRASEHGEALWSAMRSGEIATVGTDNTSRTRAGKKPEAGLHGSRPGVAVLGTHLPALLHYGRTHGVPLDVLIDRATRAPAKVFGLYPRKGTIAVGSDADLVIADLDAERVVRAEDLKGMSDFSPFEGKTLRGWPVMTIKGGAVVARDGEIVAKPRGRYIERRA